MNANKCTGTNPTEGCSFSTVRQARVFLRCSPPSRMDSSYKNDILHLNIQLPGGGGCSTTSWWCTFQACLNNSPVNSHDSSDYKSRTYILDAQQNLLAFTVSGFFTAPLLWWRTYALFGYNCTWKQRENNQACLHKLDNSTTRNVSTVLTSAFAHALYLQYTSNLILFCSGLSSSQPLPLNPQPRGF